MFAENTTLVGLNSDCDQSTCREEVSCLVSWCTANNLELNTQKFWRWSLILEESPPHYFPWKYIELNGQQSLGTITQQDLKMRKRARKLWLTPHTLATLFQHFPSQRRPKVRALKTGTTHHRLSFYPQAIILTKDPSFATSCALAV
ncbi:hypothetical protein SKAU_G00274610 [Synaphobranchus kaupii]|uniref:Reverse transcriptase domain-containing protein n=1 Tax=Synaphobranchus kaupii TaxID=118154 RepID=A0A9Q1IQQ8_SYNKA|nr:hypothetical protein SKAU_G00274610 [Synaphobranchus kaupii]